MGKSQASAQEAIELQYKVEMKVERLQEKIPRAFMDAALQAFPFEADFTWTIDMTETHLAARRKNATVVLDLQTRTGLCLYPETKIYRSWNLTSMNVVNAAQWKCQVAGSAPGHVKFVLQSRTTKTEVWVTARPDIPLDARRALWTQLIPGAPVDLVQAGVPAEIQVFERGNDRECVARLELVQFKNHLLFEPFSTKPPADYTPDQSGNTPDVPFQARRRQRRPGFEERIKELKRKYRRMETRHALRESGQSLAWIMKQDVLDQMRELLNSILRSYDRFQGLGDGTISMLIDLWPGLRDRLLSATFPAPDDRPDLLVDGLRRLVQFVLVNTPDTPVLETSWPGGLTSDEAATWASSVLASSTDPAVRFANAFSVFEEARLTQVLDTQISFMTGSRITIADADGLPIRELHFRVPDDPDWALAELKLFGVNPVLILGHNDIIRNLEVVDGSIELRLMIPQLRLNFQWESNPAWGTTAWWITTIATWGAINIFLTNAGSWNFGAGGHFFILFIPEMDEEMINRRIHLRPLVVPERSDLDWTADPAISYNPFSSELLALWSEIAVGIVNMFSDLDNQIYTQLTEALDKALNPPVIPDQPPQSGLWWPDIWRARNGPPISAIGAFFSSLSGEGAWEAEVIAHSGETDHSFRLMPITQSGPCRSRNPADGDHPCFRGAGH